MAEALGCLETSLAVAKHVLDLERRLEELEADMAR
jgi:hypothetical protein